MPLAHSSIQYCPAARRAPRHPHASGSAQRAAPPLLPPERELPAPKTPPDPLRTACVKARPSAWPPRARRPARPPVRLTQAFRDCPGQVLSRRMPGVVGPSPLTHDGPRSRPSKTRPSWEQLLASPASSAKRPSGVFAGSGPPIPGHVAIVPVCASASPPVSRDHGLRLRLKSAASSRLPLESLLPGKP